MGSDKLSDTRLKQLILFAGVVSFFLGKKALDGAVARVRPDPLLRTLRQADRTR